MSGKPRMPFSTSKHSLVAKFGRRIYYQAQYSWYAPFQVSPWVKCSDSLTVMPYEVFTGWSLAPSLVVVAGSLSLFRWSFLPM